MTWATWVTWQLAPGLLVALWACVPASVSPAYQEANLVTLTVQVVVVSPGGAQMAPSGGASAPPSGGASAPPSGGPAGGPAAGPTVQPAVVPTEPAVGVEVRAVDPAVTGAATVAPEASATTDASGIVQLQLTPGRHLIFVPRQDPSGPLGAMVMRGLPDGTLVPMWAEVDLSDGNPATITLTGTVLNP